MKKLVASVGLIAVGAASVHAQYAPGLTALEMAKPWSLSASLRGFYDDNFLTQPANYPTKYVDGVLQYGHPLSSYGTEFTPSASFNHSIEDTLMSASYIYDLKYYGEHSYTEQSHQLNARLEHEFDEKDKVSVGETFVVAQEPTLIDPSIVSTPLLVEGNNIHNTGTVDYMRELTKVLDLHLGYANNLYAYRQVGGDEATPYSYASYSAQLDRIEQLATVDLRWKALPDTTGVLGYQYGNTGYTSPEKIIYGPTAATSYYSNVRDSDQDFVYVGADHSFTPEVNGSVRLGGEYIDYYKLLPSHTSKLSPYVDVSLTDQYQPKCSAQIGVKHLYSATDVVGSPGSSPVLDSSTTAAYASVNHAVSDKLTATVLGQAQFSTFEGGGQGYNGQGEAFFVAGLNIAYHINEWWITEAGYNYSKLNSDLPDRSYTRNFVYLGVRATY
jgi:hypothetical protein